MLANFLILSDTLLLINKHFSPYCYIKHWGEFGFCPSISTTLWPHNDVNFYRCVNHQSSLRADSQWIVILKTFELATLLANSMQNVTDPAFTIKSSSENQGQSVRSGEKAGRRFSSKGGRAPGYRLSPNYFQKFKRLPVPDWALENPLYYCDQSANSFSWVLFVSSYKTAIVSPHLPGSFTKLVRARETFIFYFPNQKRGNYRWVENTFGMLSAGAIQFCFWQITMYRK